MVSQCFTASGRTPLWRAAVTYYSFWRQFSMSDGKVGLRPRRGSIFYFGIKEKSINAHCVTLTSLHYIWRWFPLVGGALPITQVETILRSHMPSHRWSPPCSSCFSFIIIKQQTFLIDFAILISRQLIYNDQLLRYREIFEVLFAESE